MAMQFEASFRHLPMLHWPGTRWMRCRMARRGNSTLTTTTGRSCRSTTCAASCRWCASGLTPEIALQLTHIELRKSRGRVDAASTDVSPQDLFCHHQSFCDADARTICHRNIRSCLSCPSPISGVCTTSVRCTTSAAGPLGGRGSRCKT